MKSRAAASRAYHSGSSLRPGRILVLVVMLTLLLPARATANNFGSECGVVNGVATCTSLGNNFIHQYYFADLSGVMAAAIIFTRDNSYGPTDLSVSETACRACSDVVVFDNFYGFNNIWGWVECGQEAGVTTGGAHPNRWCKPQGLRFNNGAYPTAFDTQFEQRYMACHEFGHTVGLRHNASTGSCMFGNVATSNFIDLHDWSHIQAQY